MRKKMRTLSTRTPTRWRSKVIIPTLHGESCLTASARRGGTTACTVQRELTQLRNRPLKPHESTYGSSNDLLLHLQRAEPRRYLKKREKCIDASFTE